MIDWLIEKTDSYPWVVVLRNWVFQAILYVEKTERIFKIAFEIALFTPLYIVLSKNTKLNRVETILMSSFVSHSINWLFNGDVHVLRKCVGEGPQNPVEKKIDYLDGFVQRAKKEESIAAVGIVGSYVRNEMTPHSDIDVRIVRNSGLTNAVKSSMFLLRERTKALFKNYALDCYLYDDFSNFEKDDDDHMMLYSEE
ncbi:nucleotidyltransferase domain-containing protein [Haloferax sp. DFSO52]|uniref:nucleotidyltransferase domain-containing protein n=1 Tax=Haloferax sp. DFSO52 TaxID=3388505 RepID=UPI003A8A6871